MGERSRLMRENLRECRRLARAALEKTQGSQRKILQEIAPLVIRELEVIVALTEPEHLYSASAAELEMMLRRCAGRVDLQ